MQLKDRRIVPLSRLKPAPHNPPRRTDKANISKLADSMEAFGLLQPISIMEDYTIIEGHRRWAAAKQLGWKEIEANVFPADTDLAQIYASVNVTMRPMSGNDALGVWLQNERAVMPRTGSNFKIMEDTIGRPLMKRMYKCGLSRAAFILAKQVASYCDAEEPETISSILEWFMEYMQDPRVILKAVRSGKAIRMKVVMA